MDFYDHYETKVYKFVTRIHKLYPIEFIKNKRGERMSIRRLDAKMFFKDNGYYNIGVFWLINEMCYADALNINEQGMFLELSVQPAFKYFKSNNSDTNLSEFFLNGNNAYKIHCYVRRIRLVHGDKYITLGWKTPSDRDLVGFAKYVHIDNISDVHQRNNALMPNGINDIKRIDVTTNFFDKQNVQHPFFLFNYNIANEDFVPLEKGKFYCFKFRLHPRNHAINEHTRYLAKTNFGWWTKGMRFIYFRYELYKWVEVTWDDIEEERRIETDMVDIDLTRRGHERISDYFKHSIKNSKFHL